MTVHANSHTHCQVTQADPQAKTWQRVYLSNAQPTDNQNERRTPNAQQRFGVMAGVVLRMTFLW
jgi:hypothetical protein